MDCKNCNEPMKEVSLDPSCSEGHKQFMEGVLACDNCEILYRAGGAEGKGTDEWFVLCAFKRR